MGVTTFGGYQTWIEVPEQKQDPEEIQGDLLAPVLTRRRETYEKRKEKIMKTLKVVKEKIGRKGRERKLTIEGGMSGLEAKSRGVLYH